VRRMNKHFGTGFVRGSAYSPVLSLSLFIATLLFSISALVTLNNVGKE
jgi:hypothetical protein